jgi:hypothetical protein
MWAGILSDGLLGPDILRVNVGVPQHCGLEMRQRLSENYSERSTGSRCKAPVAWPSRSPDFNPLDFS